MIKMICRTTWRRVRWRTIEQTDIGLDWMVPRTAVRKLAADRIVPGDGALPRQQDRLVLATREGLSHVQCSLILMELASQAALLN